MHKPKMVGMNHVAIEVGDIEEALAFYGRIFDFKLRGKGKTNAFIDMGDQFINLTQVSDGTPRQSAPFRPGGGRPQRGARSGQGSRRRIARWPVPGLPRSRGETGSRWWRTATSSSPRRRMCMRGMGLELDKTDKARRELAEKGMAPDVD